MNRVTLLVLLVLVILVSLVLGDMWKAKYKKKKRFFPPAAHVLVLLITSITAITLFVLSAPLDIGVFILALVFGGTYFVALLAVLRFRS